MRRMSKTRKLCLFGIPAIFFVTLIVLTSQLLTGYDTNVRRQRLVAAHVQRYESRADKIRNSDKLLVKHPEDMIYSSERLIAMGQVDTEKDQELKEKGNLLFLAISSCFRECNNLVHSRVLSSFYILFLINKQEN